MKDVHFGAGNIGRGFIGATLADNGFEIEFVDVNATVIDALNKRHEYSVEYAAPEKKRITIRNVSGINNAKEPEKVVRALATADLVTTAIGPKVLPLIAPLIAQGLKARRDTGNRHPLDVAACENMIGAGDALKKEVYAHLDGDTLAFVDQYVGFPNAAVDRIVPEQHHDDSLLVAVEPFKEWVVDKSMLKNPAIHLTGVEYADDLEPYIERKLFSVNTGHATVAYNGKFMGYTTIGEAVKAPKILKLLRNTLGETRALLAAKWPNFALDSLEAYHEKIVSRFENPYISDAIARVGRTPIRKLGYNERFIRPIRECRKRGLAYDTLLKTAGRIFTFDEPNDSESVRLMKMVADQPLDEVVAGVTGIKDQALLDEVVASAREAITTYSEN
ncbi:mannitol-1-phosphate 5-dehydrogenase [Ligilactobacillus sp. LYQ112]|uniref:mannitol-1-phosphate 5-dehydrogenase n=1 Tax=Ligilactobacillus sp. LYQ112 TaxID=3391060 RepID=UPI003982FFE8